MYNKNGSEDVVINPEYKKKKVTKLSIISNKNKFILSVVPFDVKVIGNDVKVIENEGDNILKNVVKAIVDNVNKTLKEVVKVLGK
jgi:hypothetical protein